VTKPELGTKRLCHHCGVRYFDLGRSPITCPKCDTVFQAAPVILRGRPAAAQASFRVVEPTLAEPPGAEFVSPENADAKARGKSTSFGDAPEGEEGVELDNESVDDDAFIEETLDTDVAEIIGDDTEPDE
jgi:uncharacterized protein (TIGR02300 family)